MESVYGVMEHCRKVAHEKLLGFDRPELHMLVTHIICYWVVAIFYDILDHIDHPWLVKHRVTRKQPGRPNEVTRGQVVLRVLLQHLMQLALGVFVLFLDPEQCDSKPPVAWPQIVWQFVLGMVVFDAWAYWLHRWLHVFPYLYKHIHSHHHRLMMPYAYGAVYNHPIEAFLMDSLGSVVALYATGMSCQVGTCFFSFTAIKTALDHCGYRFPVNPLHDVFPNNAVYHDVHHDIRYIKKNYAQPFFTFWDVICGTYQDPKGIHYEPEELDKAKKVQ